MMSIRRRAGVLLAAMTLAAIMLTGQLNAKATALSGSDWRAGNIISDSIFTNANSMTVQQIQTFLNNLNPSCDTWGTQSASGSGRPDLTHAQYAASKGWAAPPYVCLKDYVEVPKSSPSAGIPDNSYNHYDGSAKQLLPVTGGVSAAQLIYNAAQRYGINPQVLLVTIQKESAGPLTTDTWPLQSQYTYAMGAHCPDSGPGGSANCDSNYAGFSIQISESASLMRYYLNNMTQSWWPYKKVGNNNILYNPSSACGSSSVSINTAATAALYTYTPYQPNTAALNNLYGTGDNCSAYGNRNFWRIFSDWFGSTVVPQSSQYIPDGTYTLTNPSSGRVLDVAGGSTADGTSTQIYSANSSAAQQWHIFRSSDGYYRLVNVGSNRSLDVMGGSSSQGTRVQIWSNNDGCSQKWAALIVQGGLTFLNTCSGLALDISGGSTANGAATQIYSPNGSPAQTWGLQAIDQPTIPNGFYNFTAGGGGLSLSNTGTANGAGVQVNGLTTNGLQYWQVTRNIDGLYSVRNPLTGQYLDDSAEGRVNGTRVQVWQGDTSCAQSWQFVPNSNGSYALLSACSGLALDVVNGATTTAETGLQLYTSNGTPAQQWTPTLLTDIPEATYSIKSVSGQVLDVTGGSTNNSARIQLWGRNGTPAQQWTIVGVGNGLYALRNVNSGRILDVAGGSTSPGAAIQIYNDNATCAQRWRIVNNGNSTYRLLSACASSNAVDVMGGIVNTPGAKVQTYTENGSFAQMWTFDAP